MGMNQQERDREESILRRGEPAPEEVPPEVTFQMLADAGLVQIPEDPSRKLELRECFRQAMAEVLTLDEQKVVVMFSEGATLMEIAGELYITPSWAWKIRGRAFRKLRGLILSGKVASLAT